MNFIIGDVHGMNDALHQLLELIHKQDSSPTIYCVGDFCDRGPDSKRVVDTVIREKIICVRGNHDDVFDCILSGEPTATSDYQEPDAPLQSLASFCEYGMLDTFASYGFSRYDVGEAVGGLEQLGKLTAEIPLEHHLFYNSLPTIHYAEDDFFVMHAYAPPTSTQEEVETRDCNKNAALWNRFAQDEILVNKAWGKTGYFGHTPTKHYGMTGMPVSGDKIVLLDTGAVFGWGLTAVCHETQEVITVPTERA